jgi:hypothetical protein
MFQLMGGGLGEQRHFVEAARFPTLPSKIALELALGMFDPPLLGAQFGGLLIGITFNRVASGCINPRSGPPRSQNGEIF